MHQIIQDLVLESKRNSRVQNKTEGTLASVEKMNQEAQSALNSARAEIFRVKVGLFKLLSTAFRARKLIRCASCRQSSRRKKTIPTNKSRS